MPVPVAASPAPVSWSRPLGRDDVRVLVTDRRHGDLAVGLPAAELADRRRAVVDLPWSWLRQVHGAAVAVVGDDTVAGTEADALVTDRPGVVLAVHTADCAPIALVSAEGPIGVVHAGWRGVAAGVIPACVDAMRALGAVEVAAWLGPCIHPGCYEFGAADLDHVADRLGPGVRGRTHAGAPALDLPAAVEASLADADVRLAGGAGACTACDPRWFSHRARSDLGRQALVAWIRP